MAGKKVLLVSRMSDNDTYATLNTDGLTKYGGGG